MLTDFELQQAYELLIRTVKAKSKEKLNASKRGIWTGKMLDSIDAKIIQDKEGDLAIQILGEHYQEFVDEGVNGKGWVQSKSGKADKRFKVNRSVVTGSPYSFRDKMPPIEELTPWANAHNISPWALSQSIYRKGLKPVHFFNNVLDSEMDKFMDYIAEIQTNNLLNDFDDE